MNAILIFCILFSFVQSVDENLFNGVRFSFNKAKMLAIAKDLIKETIDSFLKEKFGPFKTNNMIWYFGFNTITYIEGDAKPTYALENPDHSYSEEGFKASFKNAFTLEYPFNTTTSFGGVYISKVTTRAIILAKSLNITQNYNGREIENKVSIEFNVSFPDYPQNIYSEAIKEILTLQFKKELIDELVKKYNPFIAGKDSLKPFEEHKFKINDADVDILRNITKIIHNPLEYDVRLVNSSATYKNNSYNFGYDCDYAINPMNGISERFELCFCKHLFPQIMAEIKYEDSINLANWHLMGRVMELYEIAPELINEYTPESMYNVTRKAISYKSDEGTMLLEKTYYFKVKNIIVLELNTVFDITLEGEYKAGKFLVRQKSAAVKSIASNIIIQPAGKTVVARLMLIEANTMKGEPIFADPIILSENLVPSTTNNFCVTNSV